MEFKARVALASIQGEKTLSELAELGRAVRRAPAPDHGLEVAALRPEGYAIGRKRVTTLMCRMGTEAL